MRSQLHKIKTMENDLIKELEYMGLAPWLKRISDTMVHSGRQMYKSLGFDIEPNWHTIFLLLEKHGTLSVTEIAGKLKFAHPSIISIVEKMRANGYLESYTNPDDKRKQQYKLTEKAVENLPKYKELWLCGVKGIQELFNFDILSNELEKLEDALTEKSFKDRTLENYLPAKEITIVPFSDQYSDDFASINYEWLNQYFAIEEHDREILDYPRENIIDKCGQILIALNSKKQAVGTVALINYGNGVYELSKMGVRPGYKGFKIGNKLMEAALAWTKQNKAKKVFLETNTSLEPAVNLYKKFGFKEIPLDPNSPYRRANFKMEIQMNSII